MFFVVLTFGVYVDLCHHQHSFETHSFAIGRHYSLSSTLSSILATWQLKWPRWKKQKQQQQLPLPRHYWPTQKWLLRPSHETDPSLCVELPVCAVFFLFLFFALDV
jgi:hypothetical protein